MHPQRLVRRGPAGGLDPVRDPTYTAPIWNQNTDRSRYFIELPTRFLRRSKRMQKDGAPSNDDLICGGHVKWTRKKTDSSWDAQTFTGQTGVI